MCVCVCVWRLLHTTIKNMVNQNSIVVIIQMKRPSYKLGTAVGI